MTTSSSSHDEHFMEHALSLARQGVGLASPNPTVGCVIVKDGGIVGEGFHQYAKLDHAEIVALKQAGAKARGATMYVTLEPCHHTGRTGPCTGAVIAGGISRVVAAMEDPNPKTSGNGFTRLRAAGVEVETGIGERDARALNEGFSHWIVTHRPFVTLKSALTLDGQLALPPTRRKKAQQWITGEEARAEVQRMRHTSDALLTGVGTILADDPLLTDRSGLPRRRPLLRVVLDSKLRLSPKARIVQSIEKDVVVVTSASRTSAKAQALKTAGVELLAARTRAGKIDLKAVLAELGGRDILSVLLEAGPRLNGAALNAGVVQKLVLFYAPKLAGKPTLPFLAAPTNGSHFPFDVRGVRQYGADVAIELVSRSLS